MTIGTLVTEAREKLGLNRKQASELIGLNYRTLQSVEHGIRLPNRTTLAAIERAYEWAPGVLLELWDNRVNLEFGKVLGTDLRALPKHINVPLIKASDLTTEELLAELSFRVLMLSRDQQGDLP